jgi:hypothetical protein
MCCGRHVILGYLRVLPDSDARTTAQTLSRMAGFAARNGYQLGQVYQDVADPYGERPALGALVLALRDPDVHGVIVPNLDHLSRFEPAAYTTRERIEFDTHTRVLVMDDPTPPVPTGVAMIAHTDRA